MNTSRSTRWLVIGAAICLVAGLALSGFNVYMALASPLRQQGGYSGPNLVGFEGFLADASGNPVPDGLYEITFRLYDVDIGGTPLWSETWQNPGVGGADQRIQVTDGLYSIVLGGTDPANNGLYPADFAGPRWLGIQVAGDPQELSPRIQISAVPWSLNASSALGLQGKPVAATAPQTDDVLVFSGTEWVPSEFTGGFTPLAPTQVSNTTAKTPLSSFTAEANSMGTNGFFKYYVALLTFNNSGAARTVTFDIDFGGASALNFNVGLANNATARSVIWLEVGIQNTAANAQVAYVRIINERNNNNANAELETAGTESNYAPFEHFVWNNLTVNTATDQPFVLSVTFPVANANLSVQTLTAYIVGPLVP